MARIGIPSVVEARTEQHDHWFAPGTQVPVEDVARVLSITRPWILRNAEKFGGYRLHKGKTCVSADGLNAYLEESTRVSRMRTALKQERLDCDLLMNAVTATSRAMRWAEKHEHAWLDGSVTGFVYIARARDGLVKVGFSTHPVRRLFEHKAQVGMLDVLVVIPANERLERDIHIMFSDTRVRAEWFRKTRAISAFVKWLQAGLEPA